MKRLVRRIFCNEARLDSCTDELAGHAESLHAGVSLMTNRFTEEKPIDNAGNPACKGFADKPRGIPGKGPTVTMTV